MKHAWSGNRTPTGGVPSGRAHHYTTAPLCCAHICMYIYPGTCNKADEQTQVYVLNCNNYRVIYISALFIHGFLPDAMLSVVLVPVIKDKCRKINDSDNYRPIALAGVISKVVEKILLNRMSDVLLTTCNQFGFKSKLGTDTCIYSLKEIVENNRSLDGSMFISFLDASKAFDRLKHCLLFQKLIDRKVPGYITRIMIYWYASQTMYVRVRA